ncbi:hypothetical protein GCM10009836_15710 [Pseudonocardia ailaonensis]|uniref:SH3b domain-containing protein n=1 Tax=Pseudonocardia ailaonensis TaxID=367279 RepID=A0ABN2MUF9_9PSEU
MSELLDLPTVTVHVINANTAIRTGGSTRGPDNKVGELQPGPVEAIHQATGQDITQASGKNFWWVRVRIPQSDGTGWVSVTNLQEGPENQPVPGLPEVPTTFA